MSNRKNLSKKVRFEVLKRDKFTCQYCGGVAPNVLLQIDHIIPVSKGGDDSIMNLITSCQPCNSGKKDIMLSDDTALMKRKIQLDQLQEKREQLELMIEWQRELLTMDETVSDSIFDIWYSLTGFKLDYQDLAKVPVFLKEYSYEELVHAMKIARNQYLGRKTSSEMFAKVGGILYNIKRQERDPYIGYKKHIYSIIKERLGYCNFKTIDDAVDQALNYNASIESLIELAKNVNKISDYCKSVNLFVKQQIQIYENQCNSEGA